MDCLGGRSWRYDGVCGNADAFNFGGCCLCPNRGGIHSSDAIGGSVGAARTSRRSDPFVGSGFSGGQSGESGFGKRGRSSRHWANSSRARYPRSQAGCPRKAKTDAQAAAARLERVKSTQNSDVAAQKAAVGRAESEERGVMAQAETIARLEVQREDARTQYDRFLKLSRDGAISASNLDEKRLAMATLEAQLKEAQATLVRLQESAEAQVQEANANLDRTQAVNPTDVQVAAAELASANAAVTQAQAELEVTYIRSPISATVLKVHVRPGEVIGQKGIAELGQTDQMNVVAQVYKTDINKVRVGQGRS
ncbi:MAG: hypothetical protein HC936_01760 [Leptolyngbyaceae cyanobacterium SU_3_3]|nr:hypothetical protein [Leptolyngbyaceae cyanobacterium SU_3_3]